MSTPFGQFGKYVLQRKLAEGGMAEVFLAKQSGMEGFEKPVVVKRILPSLSQDDNFVQMFLNEGRVAARLSHPSIVQIFDLGKVEDQYYIAMEFIHGEDLRGIAKQAEKSKKRPSLALVARILADTLGALHYAHTRSGPDGKPLGLVHRDISPQNILVTYEGNVKVVDFGIAKATESQSAQQTQAGLLKGKYAYMSPEQCRGKKLDARSDVFAVGILLWELITWKRLFRRDNDLATLVAVADEPIPRLRAVRPDVPPELDQICARALERDLAKRYPSAQAMQSDLEALIRKYAWEADSIRVQRYLRDLFEEKLRLQDETVRAAGLGSLEDYLVRVDAGTQLAWMPATHDVRATPTGMVPADAVASALAVAGPEGTQAARPGALQRVQPPAPGQPLVIAPVPAPPHAVTGQRLSPPTGEHTPSTMRHALGQSVPAQQYERSRAVTPPSPGGAVAFPDVPTATGKPGWKRALVVGGTGILVAGAVLAAVLWPDVKRPVHTVSATGGDSPALDPGQATVHVVLDQPSQIWVDNVLQPVGKEVEVQVAAKQAHEVRIRHGSDAEKKLPVPSLDAGAVHTIRLRVGH